MNDRLDDLKYITSGYRLYIMNGILDQIYEFGVNIK